MNRLAVSSCVFGLLVSIGVANADKIAVPTGWTMDPQLSSKLSDPRRAKGMSIATEAYRPEQTGGVLYVTRLEIQVAGRGSAATPDDLRAARDAIATAELDELRAAMRRQGANAKAEAYTQRADPAKKQLEAALAWRDTTAGLVDSSRTVIAAEAQKVVAITGQCVTAIDAPAALVKACGDALVTLDPGVPADTRVALSILGESAGAEAGGSAGMNPTMNPTMKPSDGPKLDDGSRVSAPPVVVTPPPKSESDRRPIYIGLGLVFLAVVFYWNRRRRERFEAGDERTATRAKPDKPDEPADDEDADDLHAAAANEPKAEPKTEPKEKADP